MKQFAPEYERNEQGLNELDRAYLAGVIDADGCIGIYRNGTGTKLVLQISSSSTKLMNWLQARLRKNVITYQPQSPKRQLVRNWVIRGSEAKVVLAQVFPYLVIKSKQAKLALEYPIYGEGQRNNPAMAVIRDSIIEEMKLLNNSSEVEY